MHHSERQKEIERQLKGIIAKGKIRKKRFRVYPSILLIACALIFSAPLWVGRSHPSPQNIEPIHYKIHKLSIEYPDGLEPMVQLGPAKSGCAFMPKAKSSNEHHI